MRRPLKILILFASYGDGHYQVSQALRQRFADYGANIVLADLYAQAHPAVDRLVRFIYLKCYTVIPHLYGWVYYKTKHLDSNGLFFRFLHSFGLNKLRQIIKTEQPDAVINTFPILAMSMLKMRREFSIPVYNVLTDFEFHARWVHPVIDKYYVATDELKAQVMQTGVAEERIAVSGIPLAPDFAAGLPERTAAREKLGIDPGQKTVLVVAGAYGVMRQAERICELLSRGGRLRAIIVCGRNRRLFQRLGQRFGQCPSLTIIGYANNMCELMAAADCIVTKPGGITLSEAITAELPLLLFRPLPGQELDNARYLVQRGAAFLARTPEDLANRLQELLQNEEQLEAMRQAVRSLRRPDAAHAVVLDIMQNRL
jgi:processive 1,2-diacylglycerol beta-glucosyltransferase